MSKCSDCGSSESGSDFVQIKCHHTFCAKCMSKYIKNNIATKIKCPDVNCTTYIRDAVIRKFLCEEDVDKYEKMCLGGIKEYHKCILEGCPGYIMYINSNIQYECPYCTLYNCIPCNASHPTLSCTQFKQMNESEKNNFIQSEKARAVRIINEKRRSTFLGLEEQDTLPNNVVFKCPVCNTNIYIGEGIKFRNCGHLFCKSCLGNIIKVTTQIPVQCPISGCTDHIMDQEIISVLSKDDFESYVFKHNESLKRNNPHYLQCKSPNCRSFYDYSTKPTTFTCLNCDSVNCVKCRAVHPKESCEQYQKKLENDPAYIAMKNKMDNGEIIECPSCSTILQKIKGCNWIQCTNCLLEICWILKIPRWGPKGRGDESGGCKCKSLKPCHSTCKSSCTPHTSQGYTDPQSRINDSSSNEDENHASLMNLRLPRLRHRIRSAQRRQVLCLESDSD